MFSIRQLLLSWVFIISIAFSEELSDRSPVLNPLSNSENFSIYSLEPLGISETYVGVEEDNTKFYSNIIEVEKEFPPLKKIDFTNSLLSSWKNSKIMDVSSRPLGIAVSVKKRILSPWAQSLTSYSPRPYQSGDSFLISLQAKCNSSADESGEGKCTIQINESGMLGKGPILSKSITIGKRWKFFSIPFSANKKGKNLKIQLLFGNTKPQDLLIKEIDLLYYGKSFSNQELPKSSARYQGMELDAPWRVEAIQRIEKYRKQHQEIILVDSDGNKIHGAELSIQLKKHSFGFGTAINMRRMFDKQKFTEEELERYKSLITQSFNKVVFENGLKWKLYQYFKEFVPPAVAWVEENNLTLRGHTLIWPGWVKSPKYLPKLSKDKVAFRKAILDRVSDFSNRWTEQISEWDVLNEPFSNTDFMDVLGKEIVLDIFRESERVNPGVIKYINDFGILAGNHNDHQDNYYNWIQYLHDNQAPLDGIGFQGHFRSAIPLEEVWNRIERFNVFGYDLQITEYDFDESDEILQATYTRDLMTLIFSHPKMMGFICWTLFNDEQRINQSLHRADWAPKKMMQVWDYLIQKVWHTEESLITNKAGAVKFHGFKGDYEILVEFNGKKSTEQMTFNESGSTKIVWN